MIAVVIGVGFFVLLMFIDLLAFWGRSGWLVREELLAAMEQRPGPQRGRWKRAILRNAGTAIFAMLLYAVASNK